MSIEEQLNILIHLARGIAFFVGACGSAYLISLVRGWMKARIEKEKEDEWRKKTRETYFGQGSSSEIEKR